jgi:hypothetical protein
MVCIDFSVINTNYYSIGVIVMLNYIKQCWKGEEKLWKVFWIWNILVGFLLTAFIQITIVITVFPAAMQIALNKNLEAVTFPKLALAFLGIVIFLLSLAYDIWALVSLWRSAFNCTKKVYGYIARGWIVVIIFFAVLVPILGEIFPGSIFEGSENISFFDEDRITIGPDKLPTDREWAQIKEGMTMVEAEKILKHSKSKRRNPDGAEVWEIWKAEIKGPRMENAMLLLVPSGTVFYVYFDSEKKVIRKEKKFIPGGKILELLKDTEKEKCE